MDKQVIVAGTKVAEVEEVLDACEHVKDVRNPDLETRNSGP